MLTIEGLKTRIFKTGESLAPFIVDSLRASQIELRNRDILCITSKIVSLSENRLVAKSENDKKSLVKKEADVYLADGPYGVSLTIKHGLMIPSAGIDESNADGDFFILYPKDPFQSAAQIWRELKAHFRVEQLGVILTDSHTTPLRRGVTGIALSYWGFRGVKSFVGQPDLFGRQLKFTAVHAADALATSAVFEMGEANESKCLALVRGADVGFCDDIDPKEGQIAPADDLYYSLYK